MRAFLAGLVVVLIALGAFLFLRPTPEPEKETADVVEETPKVAAANGGTPAAAEAPKPGLRFPPKKDSPQANDNRFDSIQQLLRDGRFEAAATALMEILKTEPNNERALLELGYLYARDPKYGDQGIQMLEKVLRLNPENDQAMGELLLLAMEGRGGDMVAKVQMAYERNPNSANLAAGLGRLKLNEGNMEEAVPLLERAAGSDVVAESAYNSLLDAYLAAGDKAKTVDTYNRLVDFQQRSLEEARRAGSPDAARLERSMRQNQLGLASALIAQKQYDAAESLLRQVREASPQEQGLERLSRRLEDERAG